MNEVINIITVTPDPEIVYVKSFGVKNKNDKDKIEEAENYFRQEVKKIYPYIDEEEVEACLEDGYCSAIGFNVFIEWTKIE